MAGTEYDYRSGFRPLSSPGSLPSLDLNFCIRDCPRGWDDESDLTVAAVLRNEELMMTVLTNAPGVQVCLGGGEV